MIILDISFTISNCLPASSFKTKPLGGSKSSVVALYTKLLVITVKQDSIVYRRKIIPSDTFLISAAIYFSETSLPFPSDKFTSYLAGACMHSLKGATEAVLSNRIDSMMSGDGSFISDKQLGHDKGPHGIPWYAKEMIKYEMEDDAKQMCRKSITEKNLSNFESCWRRKASQDEYERRVREWKDISQFEQAPKPNSQ